MTPWYKQKTTWTAIAGMIAAIGAYLTGEINLITLIEVGFGVLITIFSRQAIEKSGPQSQQTDDRGVKLE
jgi:hypothetical protein